MFKIGAILLSIGMTASAAQAVTLSNSDFSVPGAAGWSIGLTSAGQNTLPQVSQVFDVDLNGPSAAAAFRPGSSAMGSYNGVTGTQSFSISAAGTYSFGLDVASKFGGQFTGPIPQSNFDGGLVQLIVDGILIDSWDFGQILYDAVERTRLMGSTTLAAGTYNFTFRLLRNFNASATSPTLYVDNASISGPAAVPLPASLPLLLAGLAGIFALRSRRTG